MNPSIIYTLEIKLFRYHNKDNVETINKILTFSNQEHPITARNEAFEKFKSWIDVLLQSLDKTYINDSQLREDLKVYIEAKPSQINQSETESDLNFSFFTGNGIGIFYTIINEDVDSSQSEKKLIYGTGHWIDYSDDPNDVIWELKEEYEFYKKFKFDTQNKTKKIIFFSIDWEEGDEEENPENYIIIETPFDWTGLDIPNWWEKENVETIDNKITTIEEIIQNGEGEQIEFKPSLLYNFKTKTGGISIKAKIAQAICAFLNSKGGILLIGVTDDKKIQGLEYDFSLSDKENCKDYFKNEFDQMLGYFFNFSIKALVNSGFSSIDNKLIYAVNVTKSSRPIFIKGIENKKEFWIRGNASTRQITDIEEIVNYWIDLKYNSDEI